MSRVQTHDPAGELARPVGQASRLTGKVADAYNGRVSTDVFANHARRVPRAAAFDVRIAALILGLLILIL